MKGTILVLICSKNKEDDFRQNGHSRTSDAGMLDFMKKGKWVKIRKMEIVQVSIGIQEVFLP